MASTAAQRQERFSKYLTSTEPNTDGEWRGYCPLHEDPATSKTPSASFNFDDGTFYCFGGCRGFSLATLSTMIEEEPSPDPAPSQKPGRVRNIKDTGRETKSLPTDAQLRKWQDALTNSEAILRSFLNKRGLSKETVAKFEVGWDGHRYTFPVRDVDGVLVNVRRYKLNSAKSSDKMLNIGGHGTGRLYLPEVLRDNQVVILTEGEPDALTGQQYGLPTMSHTSGAGTWSDAWTPEFKGKTVYIVYDCDDSGRNGARKAAVQLEKVAEDVFIVDLNLNQRGADLTDYFHGQGHTADDFRQLMNDASAYPFGASNRASLMNAQPKEVGLEQSMSADHSGEALEIVATIAGKVQPAFLLPKHLDLNCTMDFGPKCQSCPMQFRDGHHVMDYDRDDNILLEMLNKGSETKKRLIHTSIGVPTTCTKLEIDETEKWNVEELVLVPSVEKREESVQTPITRTAYNVGAYASPVNSTARITGENKADPNSGRGVLQTWNCEPTKTDLDRFVVSEEIVERLKCFQPAKGETPLHKMRDIAEDMQANVTHIYGRPEMHMAYDAVWHSVMDFTFKGVRLGKGWIELLIIGDTRTGKSEAASRLSDHYNAGVLKSCEGATFAGLVGGAQKAGGDSWMVTWGTIPLNDRRLVILDEFSGIADKNIIEQMSSVRSSGKAQITKIVSQETSARTRLIWISNPANGLSLSAHNNGAMEATKGLIANPEDIARFDIAMSAAREDVESTLINTRTPPDIPHRYTSEACSLLVAWAWSRKAEDVRWKPDVEDYVLKKAEEMGHMYVPDPPLIQAENVRVKIARVAVAIAARCFSSNETGEQVIVTKKHVKAACELMNTLYGKQSFGYLEYSQKTIRDKAKAERSRDECVMFLKRHRDDAYVSLKTIGSGDFKVRDFSEFGAMDPQEAQAAVLELLSMRMVTRGSRGYMRMDPVLIQVLRELERKWEG